MQRERYVICFSGGRSSAMALHVLLPELTADDVVIFNNTGRERNETLDFVNQCAKKFGVNVVWTEYTLKDGKPDFDIVTYETAHKVTDTTKSSPFDKLIEYENTKGTRLSNLPNRVHRYCTRDLKIVVTEKYLKSIGIKKGEYTKVMGIRYDEPQRWIKYKDDVMLPLKDMRVTKQDVFNFWFQQDFDLQLDSYEGNCDLCFQKGKYKKMLILNQYPETAKWWSDWEKKTGWTFDKQYSVEQLLKMSHSSFDKKKALEPHEAQKRLKSLMLDFDDSISCFCGD